MANRFPLVVDTSDGNKIREIPEGDSLDFSSVGIANLQSLSVSGALSGASLSTTGNISVGGNATVTGTLGATGNATLGGTLAVTGAITGASVDVTGTVDANNFTINGAALSTIQVQSDWTEGNVNSAAYIKNKPTINVINALNDIGDVFVADAVLNDVLTYDGVSWQASPAAGGLGYTDFSVVQNVASGTGSLVYNNAGVFTYTPPAVPTRTSDLTNDSNFTTLAEVDAVGYTQTGDILNSGRITRSVVGGQVTLGFDESGLYTTITTGGNLTGVGTIASPLNLASTISVNVVNAVDGTTASTFKDITADNVSFGVSISTTNGNITNTNGNITATNGVVTGNQVTATTAMNTPLLANIGGTLSLGANLVALTVNPHIRMGQNGTLPTSPSVGDVWHTGETIATYVNEDGSGNPGWIYLGGVAAPGGISIPTFTNATRPSATKAGQMILNSDTSKVEVSDGSTWLVIGP